MNAENELWPLGESLPRLPLGGGVGTAFNAALDKQCQILGTSHMSLESSSSPTRSPLFDRVLEHPSLNCRHRFYALIFRL